MEEFFTSAEAWARAQGIPPPLMWIAVGVVLLPVLKLLFRRRRDDDAVDALSSSPAASPSPTASGRKPLLASLGSVSGLISLASVVSKLHVSPEAAKEVLRLVKEGKKIEAIKVYREATGVGLSEAKSAVEAIEKVAPKLG